MNLKQLFCKHDWYIIKASNEKEIKEAITEKKAISSKGRITLNPVFKLKVCLKCRKFIDEIKPEYKLQKAKRAYRKTMDEIREERAAKIIFEDGLRQHIKTFKALKEQYVEYPGLQPPQPWPDPPPSKVDTHETIKKEAIKALKAVNLNFEEKEENMHPYRREPSDEDTTQHGEDMAPHGEDTTQHDGAIWNDSSLAIILARDILRMKFETDEELKMGYISNIAMLLHDRYGITNLKTRNQAAEDILQLIFSG